MPRAHRHYMPGCIWHITHRCHNRDFLLRFSLDRRCWLKWLFEAKRRYGLEILEYTVISNHIHLIVFDRDGLNAISRSMQLVAGQTGQEYNRRKNRRGAFWEDPYHTTAVESGGHLLRCIVYIDMNPVRAGLVEHPSEWPFSGYREIQRPRRRRRLLNHRTLVELLGHDTLKELQVCLRNEVEQALAKDSMFRKRDPLWTESVAVGSEAFVTKLKENSPIRFRDRRIIETSEGFLLREPQKAYNSVKRRFSR